MVQLLATHGLERGKDDLKVIMMCEVPSNAILAERFLQFFDGSDRLQRPDPAHPGPGPRLGPGIAGADFDERDPAVEVLIHQAIKACQTQEQSTSASAARALANHPDFAQWLAGGHLFAFR